MKFIKCIKCGEIKELAGRGMCKKCYDKEYLKENRERIRKYQKERYKANSEYIKEYQTERRRKHGGLSMSENKSCSIFLGVHVAEKVLSRVFKDVKQMPTHNPGYDFVCNRGNESRR